MSSSQRQLEKEREIEEEVYRADAASMRSLVEREVSHIRYMAGVDLPTKTQKEAENESEVLDDIEKERLQLKDLSPPLVLPDKYLSPPLSLPDKYLSSTAKSTGWEEVDGKLDR